MRLTRRQMMQTSLGAAAGLVIPGGLSISRAADGFIELTAKASKNMLYHKDGPASDLWTYNGVAPGPEIRVKQGERVRVRLINQLEEPTSIHWHGIRIDNAMDGVSGLTQEAVPKGGTFEYDFIAPDAGSYWYHAHNKSWNQVARGLYGPLIVEETQPAFDREHDLTLVMDDWRLNKEGAFDVASLGSLMDWSHAGRLGNWLMVNGRSLPEYRLKAGEYYRLRLINCCNSRVLRIDPAQLGGEIIAFDGQALPTIKSAGIEPLEIAPAQRVDLLVLPKEGRNFSLQEVSGSQAYAFASFKVDPTGSKPKDRPMLLPGKIAEPDLDAAKKLKLHMTGGAMGAFGEVTYKGKKLEGSDFRDTRQLWAMNGIANLAEEPMFRARAGETILIDMLNDTSFAHAMHTHGHHFRVLGERDIWRDTVLIERGGSKKIAFVADNPGKWLLHCHMLEHAAAGMNTWFEIAE